MTAQATCHCGLIRIQVAEAPAQVTDCNCSICRRYGTLWAYYPLKDVTISEGRPTQVYMWGDQVLRFHRCPDCGCVTHWSSTDPARDRMGINANLLDPGVLAAAKIHHYSGADR